MRLMMELVPRAVNQGGDGDARAIDLLASLHDSLSAEMEQWSAQEHVLFNILTPVQCAVLVIRTYPEHCDCLAIVNAVHELQGHV
jgi:hypothetical protein